VEIKGLSIQQKEREQTFNIWTLDDNLGYQEKGRTAIFIDDTVVWIISHHAE
jgi:hypothetical protein